MKFFIQVRSGNGNAGPVPDQFKEVEARDVKHAQQIGMEQFIGTERIKPGDNPRTFTVFTYSENVPTWNNGRPRIVQSLTAIANPR